jgi:hypothetical protein
MALKVLDGRNLYEVTDAGPVLIGPFELREGQRSERMVIVERLSGADCQWREVAPTVQEQTIQERTGQPGILLALEGLGQRSDAVNANNRIYPDSIWAACCQPGSAPMKRAAAGEMFGHVDHPKGGETLLKDVACMTTEFGRSPGNPKVIRLRMVVFDNTAGRDVAAIFQGGGRPGVSSRGQGSVVRVDGHDVVQEDFSLECWDLVYNPSTPDAYPEPIHERSERTEDLMNQRLAKLDERFRKYQTRLKSGASVVLLSEDVEEIRSELVENAWGSDGTRAASLVAEVTTFAGRLQEMQGEEGDANDPHRVTLEQSDDEDDPEKGPSEPVEARSSSRGVLGRPKDARGVLEALGALQTPATDQTLTQRTRQLREVYRAAVGVEGPLRAYEAQGISAFLMREQTTQSGPPLREQAPSEVQRLVEASTAKSLRALAEVASAKAQLTEVSTKLAAAKQIIESLKRRTLAAQALQEDSKRRLKAAYQLIEALASEADVEGLRGAVEALAATHPRLPDLPEQIRRARSIKEAVRITSRLVLESMPRFDRDDMLPDQRDDLVEQALLESRQAEQSRDERRLYEHVPVRYGMPKSIETMTDQVTEILEARGFR